LRRVFRATVRRAPGVDTFCPDFRAREIALRLLPRIPAARQSEAGAISGPGFNLLNGLRQIFRAIVEPGRALLEQAEGRE
jgi:hypothetical protein